MITCLKSSFTRFVKSRLLVQVIAAGILFGVVMFVSLSMVEMLFTLTRRPLYMDNSYLLICIGKIPVLLPFYLAVLCTQFTGNDIAMRAVNNRIATGLPRHCIFLADLLTASFFTLAAVMCSFGSSYLLIRLVPVKSSVHFDTEVAVNLLYACLICIAFTAIFTTLQFFIAHRLFSLIISLLLPLALMVWTGNIISRLCEPYRYTVTNEQTGIEEVVYNELYITGTKRNIYTFLADASPYYDNDDYEVKSSKALTHGYIAGGVVIASFGGAGLLAVRRKEFP